MKLNKGCVVLMEYFAKNLFNPISGERIKAKTLPAHKGVISVLLKKRMISTNVLQTEYWLSLSGAEWARQYCVESGFHSKNPALDDGSRLDIFSVGDNVEVFDNRLKEYFTGGVIFSGITDLTFILQIRTSDGEIETFPFAKSERFMARLIEEKHE